jgi:hypothetical protein
MYMAKVDISIVDYADFAKSDVVLDVSISIFSFTIQKYLFYALAIVCSLIVLKPN